MQTTQTPQIPGNGIPAVTASTLPVRRDPPPVAGASPTSPTSPAPQSVSGPAPTAPTPQDRPRRGRPRRTPAVLPGNPVDASATLQSPLTDEELLDLGRLFVLSAKAGISPQEYAEDSRAIVQCWDRFQASLPK